ncbi:MAG: multidrug effflux MFS transporter [Pseudomonadota bacterium]
MTGPAAARISRQTVPPVALLSMLTATSAISIDIALPALPAIARGLAAPLSTAQLVTGAFLAGLGAGQIFWGWLSDWRGRRSVLLWALLGYSITSTLCALASDAEMLAAYRLIQGLCAAGPVVLSRTIVRDCLDGQEAARALAVVMVVFFFTPMVAPQFGTVLLNFVHWRALFGFCSVFGVLCMILTWRFLNETLSLDKRLRRSGADIARIGVQLFTNPDSRAGVLALIALTCGLGSYLALGPAITQNVYGFSAAQYAWLFTAIAGVQMAASYACQALLRRFSIDVVFKSAALLCAAGGFMGLIVTQFFNQSAIPLIGAMTIFMIGFGLMVPTSTAKSLSAFGPMAGTATAMLGAWQWLFAGSYSAVIGWSYDGSAKALGYGLCGAGVLMLAALALGVRTKTALLNK